MTPEEIKDFFSKPENKDTFAAVAATMGFEEVTGLKENQTKLQMSVHEKTKKIAELQKNYEDAKKMLDEMTANGISDSSGQTAGSKDKIADYERKLKKISDDLEAERKARQESESKYNIATIRNKLSEAFSSPELDIDPVYHSFLMDTYTGKARLEVIDGKESVIINDGELGSPVQEHFKKFITTDLGQRFKRVPVNTGAGASGHKTNGAGTKTIKRADWEAITDPAHKSEMAKFVVE
jgi:hypothetical protein